jgi:voltage-gated potassium channel Kch
VVVGVETNSERVEQHNDAGRWVVHGDATDADFWARIQRGRREDIDMVLLAMPEHRANLFAAKQVRLAGFKGFVAALCEYPGQAELLKAEGVDLVRNLSAEAGAGFAADVSEQYLSLKGESSPA